MDFDDTDQDKDKAAADRFDAEGGDEPVSDLGQVSIGEKLRIFANQQWGRALVEDMQEDGDGKDATNLSDSLGHFVQGAAATGAMTSDMYSAFKAQMHRAIERNDREEKQQVQINLIEDREEKKRKQEEDAEEEFEGSVDRVKAEERRERERQEWAQSTHRFGNVEMTGEEWGKLADRLKSDTALRSWLLAKMKKDGMTDAQALTMLDKVTLATKMQSLPPSQWTPEMKALDQEMKDDPALKEKIEGYTDAAATARPQDLKVAAESASKNASGSVSADAVANRMEEASIGSTPAKLDGLKEAMAASQLAVQKSTKTSAGVDEDNPFASAPDLGEHYQKAVQAIDPLDADKAKPQQVAANDLKATPPAASPGSGFAV